MPNPFFYGGRIENSDGFIGRKAELHDIYSALETFSAGQAQHISLVGERRIGKSSLLYHICQNYASRLKQPEHYRFVFVDLDNSHCHTQGGLLQFILKGLDISVSQDISLPKFSEHLERVRDRQKLLPVICLDEFEHLALRRDLFPNGFYETLRSLGSSNKLAFLTASKIPLYELIRQSNMTSTFPNIFTQLRLGELSEAEAGQLVERGRNCDQPFTEDEIAHLRALGGRHPYKLQMAGSAIYLEKSQGGAPDWKKVRARLAAQTEQAGLAKHSTWHLLVWEKTLALLRSLGKAVLVIRKNEVEISDGTALWWGGVVVVFALLLLFGWAPLSWAFKAVVHWLGK